MGDKVDKRFLVAGTLVGVSSILAIAWMGVRFGANLATVSVLDLLVVVLVALYSGFWEATAVSLTAVASLDYFFIPPLFQLTIADPQNLISLGAFESTSLIVSRLSHAAKSHAAAANRQRRDLERLYEISQQLLLLEPQREGFGSRIASVMQRLFQLNALVFFNSSEATFHTAGSPSAAMEEGARDAFLEDRDDFDEKSATWFQVVRLNGAPAGVLALRGPDISTLAASSLATLTGYALERARSLDRESRALAGRATEQLRGAVLDALAHEFKGPLTALRTASSGLLEMQGLTAPQRQLIGLIDNEMERLSRLTTSLLQKARLEGAAFQFRPNELHVPDVIESVLASMDISLRERVHVRHAAHLDSIAADRELCASALAQLLDNARKYSDPGSEIDVSTYIRGDHVVISVRNRGAPIPAADQQRIFERFYRSPAQADHPPGTGLGLAVAKRLIEAQAGSGWNRTRIWGRHSMFPYRC
jgi:two-component system sensor histidine kinase KdpD